MNKKLKTILIFVSAGMVLFLMYAFFLQPAPAPSNVTGGLITVAAGGAVDSNSADIVSLLNQMQKIQLDRAIFAGQLYQSLQDFGVPIAAEPYGKNDPFSLIESSGNQNSGDEFSAEEEQ